ncbi:hypothetical protein KIN20_000438 [Parelaphostrongylus tenuis]|uniref:Uncharacterized protein n=1 Tax=Parelaphostrongylus tenuis TaxID=148309 RepID=A0AAD5QDW8_PARTN|nr:hypothetical protein KIN20_000438 [Parelaphostrongylus tenuis]
MANIWQLLDTVARPPLDSRGNQLFSSFEDHFCREESEDSTINFPVKVNATPVKYLSVDEGEEVLYHVGGSLDPIPVFSVDEDPLDGPSTLTNALKCPVKYISKIPPTLVTDNYCFICDGDEVSVDEILAECQWWKQTSSSIRFYYSDNMSTFYQVTLLTCRGETRGAYRTQVRGGGIVKVSPDKPYDRELISKEYEEFQNQLAACKRNNLGSPSMATITKCLNLWGSRIAIGKASSHSHESTPRRATLKFQTIAKSLKGRWPTVMQQQQNPSTSSTTPSASSN